MVTKKPRIVIIGAGMAGLTAANKLYTATGFKDMFELCVVEGGSRIGGRINSSEFGGDRIEMGATWIHGNGGSPIYQIARESRALESEQPWECMDACPDEPTTIAEGGFQLTPSIVEPVTTLFKNLMDYAQGKSNLSAKDLKTSAINGGKGKLSVGSFLRQGLNSYWVSKKDEGELHGYGKWSRRMIEEGVFAIHENIQRTYTAAGDLLSLDYSAESEYRMFPGEEITIAKGYLSIIESLASVLPPGLVQLGRKVTKIEWQPEEHESSVHGARPVKLHFCDGEYMLADHVIVTVSLGVLKAGIGEDSGLFSPPLPSFKSDAISRLGYGLVNKLFLQVEGDDVKNKFPFLQMVFHRPDSEFRHKKIPWWMRKTATLWPIYSNSSVLLTWFAGKEALELESLQDEQIIDGVSTTISSFLSKPHINGNMNSMKNCHQSEVKVTKILKSKWGSDPLFLGSYCYVAVGSSGDDLDTMAEPLPKHDNAVSPSLQILFAGEATHRTHYSTTHGAYLSGLREANRLLHHYHCVEVKV